MNKQKRVLLINPAKRDDFIVNRIHMGLTLLGQIINKDGHEVIVYDFSFLRSISDRIEIPTIAEIITDFKPDIVGISVFTYLYQESLTLIEEIAKLTDSPIILGGPHITFFPEDFKNDKRISYIVKGEAEGIILDLINSATKQDLPLIINSPLPTAIEIPEINLDIAYGSQFLQNYQIQLSRGCPYRCSFCNINLVAGRKVRARDLEICIDQIKRAKSKYTNLHTITITDDCPSFNKERFKKFLKMLSEKVKLISLSIDNVRADLIDDEMLKLYVAIGGKNICLGVESGDNDVFEMVNKGESLQRIKEAAELIHKFKIQLGLCFVIGLPGDTMVKHRSSILFANELQPDYIFWNMCTPWPGTKIHNWFEKNGKIEDVRNFSTLIDNSINYSEPRAWSNDFSKDERIKAWLIANFETKSMLITSLSLFKNLYCFPRAITLMFKYKIHISFVRYLINSFFLSKCKLLQKIFGK